MRYLFAMCWAVSLNALFAAEPSMPVPSVESLICDMSNRDYRVREDAATALKARPDALAAIRKAAQSGDPDLAERAGVVFKVLIAKYSKVKLPAVKSFADARLLDCFTEACVEYPDRESNDIWQLILDMGHSTVRAALPKAFLHTEAIVSRCPDLNIDKILKEPDLVMTSDSADNKLARKRAIFCGSERSLKIPDSGFSKIVVNCGDVSSYRHQGFAFCNGDFAVNSLSDPKRDGGQHRSQTLGSVVCDGDFLAPLIAAKDDARILTNCVVIARGSVHLPQSTHQCIIIAGGDIIVPDGAIVSSELRCGGRLIFLGTCRPKEHLERTTIQNDPKALSPFRFFDIAMVGLTAKVDADRGAAVGAVEAQSALAKAGLEKGDAILAVDGRAPKSDAELRTLLRTGFVRGEASLKIRRGTETKELAVMFPLPKK